MANYVVIDTETQGLTAGTSRTLPLEVGWVDVNDADGIETVSINSVCLDWTQCDKVDHDMLRETIAATAEGMQKRGCNYNFTFDGLRRGVAPVSFFSDFIQWLRSRIDGGASIVGHNAWAFDLPILEYWSRELTNNALLCSGDNVEDTLLYARAFKKRMPTNWSGSGAKTVAYNTLRNMRVGGCNLAACLADYGVPHDAASLHGAAQDAFYTHLLWKTFQQRRAAGVLP